MIMDRDNNDKSASYEKLVNEKPPVSPILRPFRLRFRKMLSTGSLKVRSTPASPCDVSEFSFQDSSIQSLSGYFFFCFFLYFFHNYVTYLCFVFTHFRNGKQSRPNSLNTFDISPLAKDARLR